jgi:hypothetical protein
MAKTPHYEYVLFQDESSLIQKAWIYCILPLSDPFDTVRELVNGNIRIGTELTITTGSSLLEAQFIPHLPFQMKRLFYVIHGRRFFGGLNHI